MSHRTEQLSSVLHRAVQAVIDEGLSDPRLQTMITVTKIEVAQDKRTASVFVSVMPEKGEKLTMHGLRDAAKHIRRSAANKTTIHRMPQLNFKVDKGIKKQAAIMQTLAEINAESDLITDQSTEEPVDAPNSATEKDL